MPLGAPTVEGAFPASDPSFGGADVALGVAGALIEPASDAAFGCDTDTADADIANGAAGPLSGAEDAVTTPESDAAFEAIDGAFGGVPFSPLSMVAELPVVKALGIAFEGGAADVTASWPELEGPLAGSDPGFLAESNKVDLSSPGRSLEDAICPQWPQDQKLFCSPHPNCVNVAPGGTDYWTKVKMCMIPIRCSRLELRLLRRWHS